MERRLHSPHVESGSGVETRFIPYNEGLYRKTHYINQPSEPVHFKVPLLSPGYKCSSHDVVMITSFPYRLIPCPTCCYGIHHNMRLDSEGKCICQTCCENTNMPRCILYLGIFGYTSTMQQTHSLGYLFGHSVLWLKCVGLRLFKQLVFDSTLI